MNRISLFIKSIFSVLVGPLLLTGCVEEYEAELPESETHLLVVNGTINSNQYCTFQLSWSKSLKYENEDENEKDDYYNSASGDVDPVVDARVKVCGVDGSEYECTDWGAVYGYPTGSYSCFISELDPNVSYFLTIEYMGDVYQSTPEKPIRTPEIERLEFFQKDSLSDVDILLTSAAPDNPDKTTYYSWDYSETWEVRPARTTYIIFDQSINKVRYRANDEVFPKRGWKFGHNETILTESTAHYADGRFTKYRLLDIPRNNERISWYYCFDLIQRAISKAEYEYEMACRQAGWEMGGLFTPQPSALPSNIQCLTSSKRAIGYIGCSMNVVTKRLYIDGTKISRVLPEPGPSVKLSDCTEDDCVSMQESGMILYDWNDGRMIKRPLVTYWASPADFDVRLQGAMDYKPDYMPPFDEDY